MANAKLHMICGNCGQNDMFDYKIATDIDDDTNEEYQTVYIGGKAHLPNEYGSFGSHLPFI
jgi:hypothetical protein